MSSSSTVPRRSIKTVDPHIDLSSVFKLPADLPRPWDPEKLFGSVAPLELEIGSGKGLFIRNVSRQNPARQFIGIEISGKFARYSAARLLRQHDLQQQHHPQQHLPNAVIVCGDAALILRDVIPANTFSAVHVYFPDPWWKRSHRKRRILRPEVLQLIESRLAPEGLFHFWTDVEEYFTSTLHLLSQVTALQGPYDVPEHEAENDMDYHTHFERRTRLHGEKVYRTVFKKG